jgi:hypothetical protein
MLRERDIVATRLGLMIVLKSGPMISPDPPDRPVYQIFYEPLELAQELVPPSCSRLAMFRYFAFFHNWQRLPFIMSSFQSHLPRNRQIVSWHI